MICLTRQELTELSGYRRPSYIARWLRDNGLEFRIGADNWPRVMRDAAGVATPKTLTRSKPNVAALKEMQCGATKKAQARSA